MLYKNVHDKTYGFDRKENKALPCSPQVVQSQAQIPRIELSWFLELGFLEVVMQEVSRKALPGDYSKLFYSCVIWRGGERVRSGCRGCKADISPFFEICFWKRRFLMCLTQSYALDYS